MGCTACGQRRANEPAPRYEVTFPTGETRTYLTMVEARIAITSHGGGTVVTR